MSMGIALLLVMFGATTKANDIVVQLMLPNATADQTLQCFDVGAFLRPTYRFGNFKLLSSDNLQVKTWSTLLVGNIEDLTYRSSNLPFLMVTRDARLSLENKAHLEIQGSVTLENYGLLALEPHFQKQRSANLTIRDQSTVHVPESGALILKWEASVLVERRSDVIVASNFTSLAGSMSIFSDQCHHENVYPVFLNKSSQLICSEQGRIKLAPSASRNSSFFSMPPPFPALKLGPRSSMWVLGNAAVVSSGQLVLHEGAKLTARRYSRLELSYARLVLLEGAEVHLDRSTVFKIQDRITLFVASSVRFTVADVPLLEIVNSSPLSTPNACVVLESVELDRSTAWTWIYKLNNPELNSREVTCAPSISSLIARITYLDLKSGEALINELISYRDM